mmetsp:Transcript_18150/g.50804  ORF Transcript_18150/g.50804 Transcript_18150/m.50804 type:complete len:218 (-) Transcript_18150:1924-2577(-)
MDESRRSGGCLIGSDWFVPPPPSEAARTPGNREINAMRVSAAEAAPASARAVPEAASMPTPLVKCSAPRSLSRSALTSSEASLTERSRQRAASSLTSAPTSLPSCTIPARLLSSSLCSLVSVTAPCVVSSAREVTAACTAYPGDTGEEPRDGLLAGCSGCCWSWCRSCCCWAVSMLQDTGAPEQRRSSPNGATSPARPTSRSLPTTGQPGEGAATPI